MSHLVSPRQNAILLTSRKHEEVFKPTLTHSGGRLTGQSLIVIIQNDDLAMGIFLDELRFGY
jgi:hypothetical protein